MLTIHLPTSAYHGKPVQVISQNQHGVLVEVHSQFRAVAEKMFIRREHLPGLISPRQWFQAPVGGIPYYNGRPATVTLLHDYSSAQDYRAATTGSPLRKRDIALIYLAGVGKPVEQDADYPCLEG